MSRNADNERFRQRVSDLIALFTASNRDRSFVGATPGPTLEHVTRRHFVDPFLRALGWDLSKLNEEMIEEARIRGETTLRLDYLGVNQDTRIPLLIIEAKAWAAPFVAPSALEASSEGQQVSQPISLICAAIEHFKSGRQLKDSPVTQEWAEYLSKLFLYVTTVRNESGHIVTRLAILSGQWLVVFNDPEAIFLTPERVNPLLISINDAPPDPLRPSLLSAYVRAADVNGSYHALWVSRHSTGPSWKPRPSLVIEVALVIERNDEELLIVIDQSLDGCSVPHDDNGMAAHVADVDAASDNLLQRVNAELGTTLQPLDVSAFRGFRKRGFVGSRAGVNAGPQQRTDLIKMVGGAGEFLLVTGSAKHFLLLEPTVNPCACHDWTFCQTQGFEAGEGPIVARSVDPMAFFKSREVHHCAHRLVHDRRDKLCQIDAFESFLCCRACALRAFCWKPNELNSLPCGKTAQAAEA